MGDARVKPSAHILVLPGKTKRVFCGDIHGNLDVLYDVISIQRKEEAELVIAGDLVDRGGNSVEVIRTIVTNNKLADKKIYSVRGNHEKMCLKSIAALTELTSIATNDKNTIALYMLKELAKESDALAKVLDNDDIKCMIQRAAKSGEALCAHLDGKSYLEKFDALKREGKDLSAIPELINRLTAIDRQIDIHLKNGGGWLFNKFWDECIDKNTKITANKNGEVKFAEDSDIGMIQKYMESLPYIIYVDDELPQVIVHADLPFSYDDLILRIAQGLDLTEDEIEYGMWARDIEGAEIRIVYRPDQDIISALVIVGHQVDGGVRADSNTVNLDVASHYRGVALILKMPDGEVVFSNTTVPRDQRLDAICQQTRQHVKNWIARRTAAKEAPGFFDKSEVKQSNVPYGEKPKRSL